MTRWQAPARTPEAQQLYEAAEADRLIHPDKYRLGAEAVDLVIDRASRGAGEAMFGPVSEWKPGLTEYLGSAAEDGRLNALGARNAHGTAIGRLRARVAIDSYLRDHPAVENRPVAAPIVITGGWRTGTTFLFRLLAADPRLRAPLPAELGAPWLLAGDLIRGSARSGWRLPRPDLSCCTS